MIRGIALIAAGLLIVAFAAWAPMSFAAPDSEGCLADEAVLLDLRRNKEAVEAKEKALKEKEAELADMKKALEVEMKRLEALKAEIAGLSLVQDSKQEEKVAKLVETLETMSPKKSAELISKLQNELAVAAMERISTPKLAKILNIMEISRSKELTELLAMKKKVKKVSHNETNQKGGEKP
ncbi:MAG: MotE family protein [Bacteriovoracia bacterium]